MPPKVHSVFLSPTHSFSKAPVTSITLVQGYGVRFISREFFSTLSGNGEDAVNPGDLGEKITTSGIDVLRLGGGDWLRFVKDGVEREEGAVVIERFRKGLQETCIVRQKEGGRIVERKTGVMGIVVLGGEVKVGMRILVEPAAGGRVPLQVV
ncbi:hypothetical protein HOY80DRAFT_1019162 [Tuber brumale]|nr:hypothetical protein HOY80DRAFT_1019162 [Tuber brumale]